MTDRKTEALKQALEYLRDNQHYIADNERHAYVMEYNAFVKRLEALAERPAQQKPTCKQNLQVWVISNGKGRGQFSWEPQDERYWTRMEPTIKQSLTIEQPAQQEPMACKTLCELCVKRGYHFCANAAQTTPIPSTQPSKPWVGLTDEQEYEAIGTAGNDLLELAKRWADNEVHVYQFDNEARKIIKAVLHRAHAKGDA